MPDRIDQQAPQPSPAPRTPQPNRILAVPATIENCRTDYEQGADVRQTIAQQDARHR